jgi:hypothetical protein
MLPTLRLLSCHRNLVIERGAAVDDCFPIHTAFLSRLLPISVSDIRVPQTPDCLMVLGTYPKYPLQYKSLYQRFSSLL